jgi:uncharacterized protein YllA (UPF0747 family)
MKAWGYSSQAFVRPVNLFYLKEGLRQRFEKTNDNWQVVGTALQFNKQQILEELDQYPERFSPNVILRGLYQSLILPDIVFIGGGSEVAYWIPLLPLFKKMGIPFPVLLLRNSFLLTSVEQSSALAKINVEAADLFEPISELIKRFYATADKQNSSLSEELAYLQAFYKKLTQKAEALDYTLKAHAESVGKSGDRLLKGMEKKMAKVTKRKYADTEKKLHALKSVLFPSEQLQERYENIGVYYARYGNTIFDKILEASTSLESHFTIVTLD